MLNYELQEAERLCTGYLNSAVLVVTLTVLFPLFTCYLLLSSGLCTPVLHNFMEKSEEYLLSRLQFSSKSHANPQKKLKSQTIGLS